MKLWQTKAKHCFVRWVKIWLENGHLVKGFSKPVYWSGVGGVLRLAEAEKLNTKGQTSLSLDVAVMLPQDEAALLG